MKPLEVRLPDGRLWLRVAKAEWAHPLDPSFAQTQGGRWNPPASFDALYLNGNVQAARAQIHRMLEGSPLSEEDLDDDAPFLLVPATLPARQTAADAASDGGLRALGLPSTYPTRRGGRLVPRKDCQQLGLALHDRGLRGVWCRSAATPDGTGRELAFFPARPSSRARPATNAPLPYGRWRHADAWTDLDLPPQRDPP